MCVTPAASHPQVDDANDMWEEQDEEQDEDEEDGLAGQLLSDILATSKYGERSESSGGKGLCCARGTASRAPKGHRCWWAPASHQARPVTPRPRGLCLSLLPCGCVSQRTITTRMTRRTTLTP